MRAKDARTTKGSMSVSEAGRKGGQKVRDTLGKSFYRRIGSKGGKRVAELVRLGKEYRDLYGIS